MTEFSPGGGLPYKKDGGTPERYQDPVLWAWLEISHMSLLFFRPNTLKGITKAPAVDFLRLNTLTKQTQMLF